MVRLLIIRVFVLPPNTLDNNVTTLGRLGWVTFLPMRVLITISKLKEFKIYVFIA